MPTAHFDSAAWPLVRISWPLRIERTEFTDFEQRFDALLARRSPFGVIVTIVGRSPPSADVRRAIANYQISREATTSRYVAGFAFVASSPIEFGVLTAIRWLARPAYPERTFARTLDAERWVRDKLSAAHAMPSPEPLPTRSRSS